ncbi:hypothetical protein B0A49_11939 [Cryomyces minteri]|uniref:Uncharacterized protein n=1 Tax=Cryomyces minteri TaxID=331657 RepID=A0A4U0W7D5_9PEZI|nr:hypothetical protein B0A49_11939 [Cryomyces minteri]
MKRIVKLRTYKPLMVVKAKQAKSAIEKRPKYGAWLEDSEGEDAAAGDKTAKTDVTKLIVILDRECGDRENKKLALTNATLECLAFCKKKHTFNSVRNPL